jgi:spermidine synthase
LIALLVAVFIVSGAAGLIYESIWSRYLGLFVGHSAYAQIIVLVIFLGGMSLGAHVAGLRSRGIRSPLLWYAAVELIAGAIALGFHDAFGAVTSLAYDSLFPALNGSSLIAVKWGIAGLLILPQSVLLGATFPLMSAGVIRMAREEASPGRILGTLYFANSLGAAVGVLLAGFVLIEMVGLPGTLLTAGILNIVAALVVGLIARRHARESPPAIDLRLALTEEGSEARGRVYRPLLVVACGTAIASFIYEIAWIRMLSLVLGSATHSFELMLSAFILGLALGALWIRNRADAIRDPVRFLGIMQWVMGILAIATLPLYVASFEWIAVVINTVQENANGYRVFQISRYAIALLVMLPATFCAGTTLPLITRVLMLSGAGERAIGTVYAVNTLGSIVGVALAGLFLMPLLGLKGLLVLGAALDIALGFWLMSMRRPRADERARLPAWQRSATSSLALPAFATAGLLALIALVADFDLARITSGVYRHGVVADGDSYTFPFYKDGRTATVSMRRGTDGFMTLATNGKPDASLDKDWMDTVNTKDNLRLTRDIATQVLLPLIALAHAPRAQSAAVIGHGSGMSSHVLLGSPQLKELVTIEIEPEMIRASRLFRPANRRVFDDPRSSFVIDDAKSYFASSGRQFDLILSEPSNPWVSGVSGLFTVEFYERVKRQLSDSAVFGQWLHLYELNDGLVTSVLAAIDTVFPAYEIFYTSNSDILVVASKDSLRIPDWNVVSYDGIAADLRRAVPLLPEAMETLRLGGREVLHWMVLAGTGPNSDYFPTLDLGAERMRFMRESANGYMGLTSGRFDVVAALAGRRRDFGTLGVTPTPEIPRAVALSMSARVRAVRSLPPDQAAEVPRDDDLRESLSRIDRLYLMLSSGRPPADWYEWMRTVIDADEDLHGGTAGVADSAFFRDVRGFASRYGAPAEARSAIDFLEGISAWDWPKAVVSSKLLIASADSVTWIPDPLLRNGSVVAHLKVNDVTGAQDVLKRFAKRTNADRFKERLLSAYLISRDSTMSAKMGWR